MAKNSSQALSTLILVIVALHFPSRSTPQSSFSGDNPSVCSYPCLPPPTVTTNCPPPPSPLLPPLLSPPPPPPSVPGFYYPPPAGDYYPPPSGNLPYYYPPPAYVNPYAPPPPNPILPYFPWYYKYPPPSEPSSEKSFKRSTVWIWCLGLSITCILF